jgi:hypothetical protein
MADRFSGKASKLSWGGVDFPIKKYTPKTTRKLADTTDTGDYDVSSDMLWETQVPVSIAQELSIEGYFRKSITPTLFVTQLYSGVAAVAVILTLDAGTLFGHGNYDISDFSCDIPSDDVVSFSCTAKLNGIFTPNA